MVKIEYNKKYGNSDYYMIWEKTGKGEKCIKLTGTLYSDGEIDGTENVFIPVENIRAENEKSIIAVKVNIDSCFREWIEAEKPGGFKNSNDVLLYEKEIAIKNLS